jgi:DNA modification methylase
MKKLPKNEIVLGDCLQIMKQWDDNSIDTVITDPPYGLSFMGKDWDHGVPGKVYWEEVLRVAKPGTILLAFGGTRTYHRLTCVIEDAGWEIRDCMMWLYGSGFPKSHNISKAIDRKAGKEREVVGKRKHPTLKDINKLEEDAQAAHGDNKWNREWDITKPATTSAEKWEGYGTALKPAFEPIVVAMKPIEESFANNAEKYNVAGLNINESRIGIDKEDDIHAKNPHTTTSGTNKVYGKYESGNEYEIPKGRWPANIILDEEAAKQLDEQAGDVGNGWKKNYGKDDYKDRQDKGGVFGGGNYVDNTYCDQGGPARFFYCAKASKSEKTHNKQVDNIHPTVKPIKLMEYLCTLTKTPTGGIVLDPFAGSGSTLIAAINTNRDFIGIEKEKDFFNITQNRIKITKDSHEESLFE